MNRVVDSEWLDHFAPDDPCAKQSRRDLQRLNRILQHAPRLGQALAPSIISRNRPRVVDLGAGDGWFALHLAHQLPRPREAGEFILVDKHAFTEASHRELFKKMGWNLSMVQADVFQWLETDASGRFDAAVANLFLHHFDSNPLRRLLGMIADRSACFAACETLRNPIALAASYLAGMIGCGKVTRHDAVVSVRAGFRAGELTQLWPSHHLWQLEERRLGWCSHWFMARRRV